MFSMPNQQPTMAGFNYQGQPTPQTKHNNVLTPEQMSKLRQNSQQFSLSITEEEWLRAVCNHQSEDGLSDTLVIDPETGEAVCTVCGYKFKPVDQNASTPEYIRDAVYTVLDILQTIKMLYIDLPADAAKEYFPIIPLIEKIPQLFEYACKNMQKHEVNNWTHSARNMNTINMFQNLQNVFGAMNQPMAAPMGGGYGYAGTATPQHANPFGYPGASAPMPNPAFGVGAQPPQPQAGGYQPQAGGYQFIPNPQQATQPVTPTVTQPPTEQKEVKVTEKVEV